MPTTECCVPLCENKGGHAFPFSDPDRLKAWIVVIRRDKWTGPTRYTTVCYAHFDADDYIQQTTSGKQLHDINHVD